MSPPVPPTEYRPVEGGLEGRDAWLRRAVNAAFCAHASRSAAPRTQVPRAATSTLEIRVVGSLEQILPGARLAFQPNPEDPNTNVWTRLSQPQQRRTQMRALHSTGPVASRGLTFIEVTIVMMIAGLIVEAVIKGQELIQSARVRNIISQQTAAESAFLAFQDRFRAPPGDYAGASANINCGASACLNGNGNGRVEAGTGGAIHEEILAWQHLTAAGFLTGNYQMLNAGVAAPTPDNTPSSVFGGYLEIVFDSNWGYSGNTAARHNIKTGNYVPAAVLAEVDRKMDDGRPGSGRFQFSIYAGAGTAPPVGGTPNACTDADSSAASWNALSGSDNCGAATLVY